MRATPDHNTARRRAGKSNDQVHAILGKARGGLPRRAPDDQNKNEAHVARLHTSIGGIT